MVDMFLRDHFKTPGVHALVFWDPACHVSTVLSGLTFGSITWRENWTTLMSCYLCSFLFSSRGFKPPLCANPGLLAFMSLTLPFVHSFWVMTAPLSSQDRHTWAKNETALSDPLTLALVWPLHICYEGKTKRWLDWRRLSTCPFTLA